MTTGVIYSAPRRDRRRRVAFVVGRSIYLVLLLAVVIAGCGSSGDASEENAAPEYAATPHKALESWVTAVRAGDIEMMCRLVSPHRRCKKALVKTKLLRPVRAEMRGLTGDLHYGAIDIGAPEARIVIGVVSGDSQIAYAVPVARGKTQWSIDDEEILWGFAPPPRAVLERPDPGATLPSGRTAISFTAAAYRPGSNYPNAELWIDSRHVNGRLGAGRVDNPELEAVRWIGLRGSSLAGM
jgi:hypothetical protein